MNVYVPRTCTEVAHRHRDNPAERPKPKPPHQVTEEQIQQAVDLPNDRPRKCLGYQTPREAFWDVML